MNHEATPSGLKAYRASLGKTQKEFAEHLGVSPGAVKKWEQGSRKIPGWLAKKIKSSKMWFLE